MAEIRYTTEFAAPPAAVWPYLEEPDKIKQWMSGVLEDRPTSEGPLGVGSTFEMKIKEGARIGTYQGEITAYEPPRHMALSMSGGYGKKPMTMHVDYRLADLGGGRTRLDYRCEAEMPKGFLFKLMGPLFLLFGRSVVKKFMRNLRPLVEAPDQRTAGS
jgi:uncharacterized protein YndB with AHSA1/START domain